MKVRMLVCVTGETQTDLEPGQVYEVSDVFGAGLLQSGRAVASEEPPAPAPENPETGKGKSKK